MTPIDALAIVTFFVGVILAWAFLVPRKVGKPNYCKNCKWMSNYSQRCRSPTLYRLTGRGYLGVSMARHLLSSGNRRDICHGYQEKPDADES